MLRLHFLLAVLLLIAYPQKSLALQAVEKPPKPSGSEEKAEDKANGPGVGATRLEDSVPSKAKQVERDAEHTDQTVNTVKTGIIPGSMSERDLKRQQQLDLDLESPNKAIGKPTQEARAISQGGNGDVLTLVWSVGEQKHHFVHIQRGSSPSQVIDLGDATNLTKLNRLVSTAGVTVLEGDYPENPSWHKWLSTSCKSCVLSSRRSANRDLSDKVFAALLGSDHTRVKELSAYNALPYEKGDVGRRERARMGIDEGSEQDWTTANDRIRDALGGGKHLNSVRSQIVEKESLLRDLREGEADVVLIFAHSDGSRIYLPGKDGSSISVEELRAVKRQKSPNRVVILVACRAGAVNHGTHSIAEALLESKLATTVFAYPGRISASYVPGMLARLRAGGSLRDALPGLYQIVTMRGAQNELCRALRLRPGIQVQQFYGAPARRRYARVVPGREERRAIVSVGSV